MLCQACQLCLTHRANSCRYVKSFSSDTDDKKLQEMFKVSLPWLNSCSTLPACCRDAGLTSIISHFSSGYPPGFAGLKASVILILYSVSRLWLTSCHICSQKFGKIQSCTVLRDHAGKSKQVGFVQFSSEVEATSCVSEMHGKVSPLPRFPLTALLDNACQQDKWPTMLPYVH